MNLCWWA